MSLLHKPLSQLTLGDLILFIGLAMLFLITVAGLSFVVVEVIRDWMDAGEVAREKNVRTSRSDRKDEGTR